MAPGHPDDTSVVRGPSDLHMHSTRSDGTEPPGQVMAAAHAHGIRTAALTDHDTTAGWAEAAESASSLGMSFLPGMELSTRREWRSVHILAYLFDPDDPTLRREIERIRRSRRDRIEEMVARIARDYPVTLDDVLAHGGGDATVGRPHIADALIRTGVVGDRTEAFAGILSPGGGYYVALYAPDPLAAVGMILAAGGVAIMAHPAGRAGLLSSTALDELVAAGLAGFEVGHRENSEPQLTELREFCRARDLIVTGSSDYHGLGKPNVPGEYTTDDEMVERIIRRGTGFPPLLV